VVLLIVINYKMSYGGFGQNNAEQEMMAAISMKVMLQTSTVCFKECVNKFSADKLDSSEQKCIQSCAKRTMDGFASMNEIQAKMQSAGGMGGGF
jgi:hypothetical protein